MSKHGHALVACAAGALVFLVDPHLLIAGAALAAAGSAPDVLEIVVGFGANGERHSILPHRTLTHSPYPWLLLAIAAGSVLAAHVQGVAHIGALAVLGIALGAVLHLALDIFSPSGIPLGNPFGTRTSLGPFRAHGRAFVYRTGTMEELRILAPCAAGAFLVVALIARRFSSGELDPRSLLASLFA